LSFRQALAIACDFTGRRDPQPITVADDVADGVAESAQAEWLADDEGVYRDREGICAIAPASRRTGRSPSRRIAARALEDFSNPLRTWTPLVFSLRCATLWPNRKEVAMTANSVVRARIDERTKNEAAAVLKTMASPYPTPSA
jgi:hypothetical protein